MTRGIIGKTGAHGLVLVVLALVLAATTPALAEDGLLAPDRAYAMSRQGDLLLLDIRTPEEWDTTGLPAGAARSNWWQRGGRAGFLAEVLTFSDGDRSRPIAVICARGDRSKLARRFLRARGFETVYDIGEGMLGSRTGPGWLARDLPTQELP